MEPKTNGKQYTRSLNKMPQNFLRRRLLGSSPAQLDDVELYDLGTQNLLRLGLLERRYDTVKRGEYPPFDPEAGDFKSRVQISYLGRMLLKEAGIDLPV